MEIQETHKSNLDVRQWHSLLLTAALASGGIFLALSISSVAILLPKLQIKDEVLHAVFEILGCMLALGIGGFLLMRQGERNNGYMLWLACSVLVMGLLDAFHASMTLSNESICLRSIAQLIGGLCIAAIWLPERLTHIRLAKALPKVLATAAGLFGIILLLFPEILPEVLSNGRFTLTAKMLNFTGGIFFLAGVAYCLIRFDCRRDTISALFAIFSLSNNVHPKLIAQQGTNSLAYNPMFVSNQYSYFHGRLPVFLGGFCDHLLFTASLQSKNLFRNL